MKGITHEGKIRIYAVDVPADGTSLQGTISCEYSRLLEILDQPTHTGSGDGKVQVEWVLMTPDGVCTIYDWKESKKPEEVTEWHIGGKTKDVIQWVELALKPKEEE